MKSITLKSIKAINCFLATLIISLLLASCTGTGKKNIDDSNDSLHSTNNNVITNLSHPKISFVAMEMPVDEFLKIIETPDFKRIICQFSVDSLNTADDKFSISFASYAFKKLFKANYFAADFLKPASGRGRYDTFISPYRLGNIELRRTPIKDFIKELKKKGDPIENYKTIVFSPFVDRKYPVSIINLEILLFKEGETQKFLKADLEFDPSPPALPQE